MAEREPEERAQDAQPQESAEPRVEGTVDESTRPAAPTPEPSETPADAAQPEAGAEEAASSAQVGPQDTPQVDESGGESSEVPTEAAEPSEEAQAEEPTTAAVPVEAAGPAETEVAEPVESPEAESTAPAESGLTAEAEGESTEESSAATDEGEIVAAEEPSVAAEAGETAAAEEPSVAAEEGETAAAGEPSVAAEEGETAAAEAPSDALWYVIHCYSGYENKVRHNLEQRIETMGMKDKIFDVVIPTQEEIEVKEGKRRTVERHIFPGYVLVQMALTEESWYVVRNTPGVTGFVGMGNLPTPLRPEEVAQIVKRMEAEAPTIKVSFKLGERVRIIDGPFNDFRGTVSDIDMERTKVRVMVSFFGRETPVELDFLQVEKS